MHQARPVGDISVSTRLSLLVAIVFGLGAGQVFAQATSVTLQLFPFTGEVRILNDNLDPFTFVVYSLNSPSGALNGTNGIWTSIADTYDVSGSGFIDPTHEWVELTPNAMAGATNLSESVIPGPGGVLPAQRAVSLGKIWNPSATSPADVTAQIGMPDGSDAQVIVRTAIDGDYFRDRIVDDFDYAFWKTFFGSSASVYADGNIDGIVDAADYTVWRNNLGLSLPAAGDEEPGAGAIGLAASVVPEPTSLLSAIAAIGGWLLRRSRRRHFVF
jgi:hypothetical protein